VTEACGAGPAVARGSLKSLWLMFQWLRKLRRHGSPLSGAPATRRLKFYSAQGGYVYQYYYAGHRVSAAVTEYVFQVSGDRRTYSPVSVHLAGNVLANWHQQHGRELSPNERYAVVKMALFQAFDERGTPSEMRLPVQIRPAGLDLIAETLGFE